MNSQYIIALLLQLLRNNENNSLADDESGRQLPVTNVQELELINSDASHSDVKSRLVRICRLHTLLFIYAISSR